ncbi:MAG: (2Fe-2S) ferredoxin domain-containing protein [Sporomusa sp.]
MLKLSICFGSACHLRGSYGVLNAFKALIEKYQVDSEIDIEGNFCQNYCTEGVVIKLNDEIITHVTKEKVYDIFMARVLGGK